ncbi:hypothetical protein [Flavobacterium facile]|uniref:hypothetical protein n=1 Tax=Flavobacterium facile TaxID=2893174 RepID=UPI002E79E793|nr:hypothetical protein [Flavobacterium sp. T-12]
MSITTNNQTFISAPSTPALQDWESLNPLHFVYLLDQPSAVNPAPTVLKIRDITPSQDALYTTIKYSARKTYINNNYGVNWLNANSTKLGVSIPSAADSFVNLSAPNQTDNVVYSIENLNLLPVGNYQAKVTYKVWGLSGNTWNVISSFDVMINFDIYDNEYITWDSPAPPLNHIYGNPIFGNTSFTMNGPSWKIISQDNNIQLSCDDVDVIYDTDVNGNWLSGSGTHVLKINATSYHNTAPALAQSPINRVLYVFAGDTTIIGYVGYQVNILNTSFFASPTNIDFNVIIGEPEPDGIIVDVFSLVPYTYTVPYWLTVTVLSESAPGIPSKLLVKPIPYINLSAGIYTDSIVLSGINGGVPTDIDIMVTYTISNIITLPYSDENYNFTKDPLLLDFHSDIPDTYFEMKAIITCSDFVFQSTQTKNFEIPFKIPLFNKKQQFNLGKIVEKAMYRFVNPLSAVSNLYNSTSVTLDIKERLNNTNVLVRDLIIQDLKFLSGLTPKFKFQNNGFLDLSNGIKRVTPESIEYINMMLTIDNEKSIEILKNNVSVFSNALLNLTETYKLTIDFSTLSAVEGDVIDIIIWMDIAKTISISKKYLVFPKQEYSTLIIWENEYRVPEIFDFTGKYFLKSDIENLQTKNFNKIVERTNLVDNFSTEKVIINTGFISSNDITYIKSIIKQRRAWILLTGNKLIELIPLTKQLQEVDVNRELIDFDIEFQINKIYDEENNSF